MLVDDGGGSNAGRTKRPVRNIPQDNSDDGDEQQDIRNNIGGLSGSHTERQPYLSDEAAQEWLLKHGPTSSQDEMDAKRSLDPLKVVVSDTVASADAGSAVNANVGLLVGAPGVDTRTPVLTNKDSSNDDRSKPTTRRREVSPLKSKSKRTRTSNGKVDEATKKSYLEAVQLLQQRIAEKADKLSEAEHSFLRGLLLENHPEGSIALPADHNIHKKQGTGENLDEDVVEDNDDMEERLSAVGSAIETLEKDPLFAGSAKLLGQATTTNNNNNKGQVGSRVVGRARSTTSTRLGPSSRDSLSIGNPIYQYDHGEEKGDRSGHGESTKVVDGDSSLTEELLRRRETMADAGEKLGLTHSVVSRNNNSPMNEEDVLVEKGNAMDEDDVGVDEDDIRLVGSGGLGHENEDDDDADEKDSPYRILLSDQYAVDNNKNNLLLRLSRREALRGFLPFGVSEENFWLKFVLHQHGTSLLSLLDRIRASRHTLICVETDDGSIFGSFTSSPWRIRSTDEGWYGTGEAFLFRFEGGKLEVYPFTGSDDLVQYCTEQMIAIGGGDWHGHEDEDVSPYGKKEPNGIGIMIDADLGGGESNSCATFANPKLSLQNEFRILRLEVWTLTPCMSIQQAERLELHKLFVEQNLVQH